MAEAVTTKPQAQAPEAPSYMNADQLRTFVQNLFCKLGVSDEGAYITADVLVQGDLRGVDSHGVARLFQYIKRLQDGLIEARPNITVKRETPVSVALDGG